MIPFIGPSHPLPIDRVDLQRAINLYPVSAEDAGEKTDRHMRQAPGLTTWSPEPEPPVGGASIGWGNPVTDSTGFAHANSGTSEWVLGLSPQFNDTTPYYVGVVGGTAGVVVWSVDWAPIGTDPAPTTTPAGAVLAVQFDAITFLRTSAGLLTISATVDGVPTDSVVIATLDENYNDVAWGPA